MNRKLACFLTLITILLFFLSGCVTPSEENKKSPGMQELETLTEFTTEPPPPVAPSQMGHVSPEGSETGWILGGEEETKKSAEEINLSNLQLEIKASLPGFEAHESDLTVNARVAQVTAEKISVSFSRETKAGLEASGAIEGKDFNSYNLIHPFYWQNGSFDSDLIWLNENAFVELTTVGDTKVRLDFLGPRPAWLEAYAKFLLLENYWDLRAEQELVSFKVNVNGVEKEVQAVKAFDDMLNEYIILDNPKNALILQLTYHAKSTEGLASIDSTATLRQVSGWKVTSITSS